MEDKSPLKKIKDIRMLTRVGAAMGYYQLFKIRKPLSVQILITKFCDMTCDMCFTYPIDSKEKFTGHKEPTLANIKNLIDQSCDLGAQVIVPFGGEPLIRKDIGEIINYIKRKKRYCVLYTNATYLKNKIDDIREADQLVISMDGDEETHDSIRGEGSYQKCIEGVELALKKGYWGNLRLHTVLTKKTLHSLPHMKKLAKKYDVLLNYGYTDATTFTLPAARNFVPSPEETRKFLRDYLEAHYDGVKISTPKSVIKRMIKILDDWPNDNHTITENTMKDNPTLDIPRCGLKDRNLYIDSDGRATPCLPLWGRSDNPNVYDSDVKSAWDFYSDYVPSFNDDSSPCYQCRSIFTIEKGLFYTFSIMHLFEYIEGFKFLKTGS